MSSHFKKILAITLLTALVGFNLLPIFPVFAQTTATDEPPFECWPKKDCKGNWYRGSITTKSCGPYEKKFGELGFCYAAQPKVNLQVAIGGKNTVAGLTDYIPSVYNYALSIVSILAIIMIMVGGLRYLTAGGDSGKIGSAKETILGAVIGLFLAFGSYLLLQTINPALTELKMPDIKMIRTVSLKDPEKKSECDESDKTSQLGEVCQNTCQCKLGTCTFFELSDFARSLKALGGAVEIGVNLVGLGGGSIATGAGRAYFAVKSGSKLAVTLAEKGAAWGWKSKGIIRKAFWTPVGAGVGAAPGAAVIGATTEAIAGPGLTMIYEAITTNKTSDGICIAMAKNNVPPNELCAFDENCMVGGKCIVLKSYAGAGLLTLEGSKGTGVCANGKNASACETNTDCLTGLWCVDSSNGKYTKQCTDGKTGSPCKIYQTAGFTDCKVTGDKCKSPGSLKPTQCLPDTGSIDTSVACTTDAQCGYTGKFGDWRCVNSYCSNGTDGTNCHIDATNPQNSQICQNGFSCAFEWNGIWVEDTGDQSDYTKNQDLLSAWQTSRSSPNQVIICTDPSKYTVQTP
ncbi:MAG: pilin [Patescibacteria group bacterium]